MKIKAILLTCLTVCFTFFGCTPRNQNDSELIHINLRGSFPEREIRLEEVATIEFLQLETHEDFLFRGFPSIITSKKIIFAHPFSGNILIFSRDGSPISRFNRQGGGPEEFPQFRGIIYDEVSNEIFVTTVGRIMVYSLTGEFKRALPLLDGATIHGMVNFDSESLLLFEADSGIYPSPFSIISKKDGSVVAIVDVPPRVHLERWIPLPTGRRLHLSSTPFVRHNDGFLLNIYASDTVFLYRNGELSPFFVRTPGVHSMNPMVFIRSFLEAGNFQFFDIQRLHLDQKTHLMRDKRTGSVYRQRIIFDDFRGKNVIIQSGTVRCSGVGLIRLDLVELQDANDEGRLSGRLREIVENSEEDGNDVFMLLYFK